MSVLASVIIGDLNDILSDTSNSKWTEAEKLAAVNRAIVGAWPHIRKVNEDTTQTLAAGTYEYSPSATPEVETGYAQAYATLGSTPDVLLRGVTQSLSSTTWTIHAGRDADDYSGCGLRLVYTSRLARVTATTDAIELPQGYLFNSAGVWLMTHAVIKQANADVSAYEKLLVKFERDLQVAQYGLQRGLIAHTIPIVQDGSSANDRITSGYAA